MGEGSWTGHDIYVEPGTVDVDIRHLRKAVNADGGDDIAHGTLGRLVARPRSADRARPATPSRQSTTMRISRSVERRQAVSSGPGPNPASAA